jgi:hypothetical protein
VLFDDYLKFALTQAKHDHSALTQGRKRQQSSVANSNWIKLIKTQP